MSLADLDIVYFVKDSPENEELKYSLRSVEKNFPHKHVWFIGGKPKNLEPDKWLPVKQNQVTKWANTSILLRSACENPEISDDFVLFNDDFFILHPVEDLPYYSDGPLYKKIHNLKLQYIHGSMYCTRLESTWKMLQNAELPTISYAVHYPIIINKAEMLETFHKFPNGLMWRSIYGNHHHKMPTLVKDCKIKNRIDIPKESQVFVSTQDSSFNGGKVGEYLREKFSEPCKFEV